MRPPFPQPPSSLLRFKEWRKTAQAWGASLFGGRLQSAQLPVVFIAVAVIGVVCLLEIAQIPKLERFEWMTYDARVKLAARHPASGRNATNLGFVWISDETIDVVNNGDLGYSYGLYWPRLVYADALAELSAQGAKTVGFDVLFSGLRPGDPPVKLADGSQISSDQFFARELGQSGNAILAAEKGVLPAPLFRPESQALGNISTVKDADGVLRRDRAFADYRTWHPFIRQIAREYDLNLDKTIIDADKITFLRKRAGERITFPTDKEGFIDTTTIMKPPLPAGVPARFPPYSYRRVWSMGIVLAATELHLDLDHAKIQPRRHRIVFAGENGVTRVLPIDDDGRFYINWELGVNNPIIKNGSLEEVLFQGQDRAAGKPVTNLWRNHLIMVGSMATGNDLTDQGATPLDRDTFLVGKHLNIANSILTDRYIITSPMGLTLFLIAAAGALAAWITAAVTRPLAGTALVIALGLLYVGAACWLFTAFRLWLPIFFPLVCSGLVTHALTLTYRARAEQAEKKRVKSVFAKMLAPEVVEELLGQTDISLGGVRREITIYFADVRGFTTLTDLTQLQATEHVEKNKLSPPEAEAHFDRLAKETLATVSLYLGAIAAVIKDHNGTLDKYIGDCVMAFWGGPVANPKHATDAVKAAIKAQRAVLALNLQRDDENKRIARENQARLAQGLAPQPLYPLLSMGTGVNSGAAIMGLMGSNAHGLNYTVFGREVNLASRLEGLSGHGRIIISEATYQQLRRDDPALAVLCVERPAADVKGFQQPVKNYEVTWRSPDSPDDPQSLNLPYQSSGAETGMFIR